MKASPIVENKSVNYSEANRNSNVYTKPTQISKKIDSAEGNTRSLVY